MSTAFDNYSKPLQGESNEDSTPYAQVVRQQAQGGYQSIPGATQQTAAATKAGTLAANRQGSYLSYLNQVVNGTLPSNEAELRAPYIPKSQGTAGYFGSGYVDRNVKMAPNAIPSAYQYAGIANDSNPYGIDQLEWGGPASGKTGNPLDYVPFGALSGLKGDANTFLRNALIPDNLAGEVSTGLFGKWMSGWDSKFNQLADDRASRQGSWWSGPGTDWANKSINPAWNEVISPEIPGVDAIPYRPAVYQDVPAERRLISPEVPYKAAAYEDVPARRELVSPERPASPGVPYRAAVYKDVPAQRILKSPERPASLSVPYRAAVYKDIPAERRLVTPEQKYVPGVPAGYYTPDQTEYSRWVDSEYEKLLNEVYTLKRVATNETASFTGRQADAWQDEFLLHKNSMLGLYAGVPAGGRPTGTSGSTNFDPSSPNNYFRFADTYGTGGQGAFTSYFDTFNASLGYDPWGDPASYLRLTSVFPSQWGNYQSGSAEVPYRAAVYEDIPAQRILESPEQQYVPGVDYQAAVYEDIPAQRILESPEQQYVPGVDYQAAVYRDIPAQRILLTPEQQYQAAVYWDSPARRDLVSAEVLGRPAIPGAPEVSFYHPQTNKPGFGTVIDPITGVPIPNYYMGGPFNSNSDLQAAYGSADWYFR